MVLWSATLCPFHLGHFFMAKPALKKKLDNIFKLYIRMRDLPNGYGNCCSCNRQILFSESDGGHFINCGAMPVRWDEMNVHAQCRPCNRFKEGNGPGYTLFMIDRYGRDRVQLLIQKSEVTTKYWDFEVEMMIKDYRARVKDMKKTYNKM